MATHYIQDSLYALVGVVVKVRIVVEVGVSAVGKTTVGQTTIGKKTHCRLSRYCLMRLARSLLEYSTSKFLNHLHATF